MLTPQSLSGAPLRARLRARVTVCCAVLCSVTAPLAAQPSLSSGAPGGASSAYIKLNASTLLGIPGVAYEVSLTDRTSFNLDATASLWRSVRGAPFEFLTILPEWQIHSRSQRLGFYGGVHLGATIYRLQKWNYRGTRLYQEGYSTLLGGTVGYKRQLTPALLLDAYIGGGSQHGRYRGYDGATGAQYAGEDRLDESREWLPYRLGLMLGYRVR